MKARPLNVAIPRFRIRRSLECFTALKKRAHAFALDTIFSTYVLSVDGAAYFYLENL